MVNVVWDRLPGHCISKTRA